MSFILIAGLLCTSLMLGTGSAEVIYRPIEDWLVNNPFGGPNWMGPEGYLIISPEYYPFYNPYVDFPAFEYGDQAPSFSGTIEVETLADGRAKYEVTLIGTNAPLRVTSWADYLAWRFPKGYSKKHMWTGPEPQTILGEGEDGLQDYVFHIKFILDGPNEIIPLYEPYWDMEYEAWGEGTFTEYASEFGFTPGTTGKIHVNQKQIDGVWIIEIANVYQEND